jgi:AcrR family transcriptional regulator
VTHEGKSPAKMAVLEALSRLVLTRRSPQPPVADLLREAGVARSTFYEHFDGRDSALIEALEGPLRLLAEAATGVADEARLSMLLDHFRDNRRSAADLLSGPLAGRIRRRLAALIEPLLDLQGADLALELANHQLAQIRLWLEGETRHSAARLAAIMIAGAAAFRAVHKELAKR